jgi:RNA polymerase sigma-70 factor (ECF subfamily)
MVRTRTTLHLVTATRDPQGPGVRDHSVDELYEKYALEVKRWASRLAGPREVDLQDLVHDVFVIALRRHFIFRGDAHVRTWLFRITRNVVRNRRRRAFIRGLLFRRHQDALIAAIPTPATPEEESDRHERHCRLYQALDRLPDCYRTTLILYEIERLSGEEVAALTGTSLGTVWVRLHRGRSKLVQVLKKEERR